MLISNSVYHILSYQFRLISEHCIELISYLNQIQITSIPIKGNGQRFYMIMNPNMVMN